MTTIRGKHKYRDAWGKLEEDARKLVLEIVRVRTERHAPEMARCLGKLQKHLEKCEVLGGERYNSWSAAEQMAIDKEQVGFLQTIWELLTDDKTREMEEKKKLREMNANSKKAEKIYEALVRERDRLIVEMKTIG